MSIPAVFYRFTVTFPDDCFVEEAPQQFEWFRKLQELDTFMIRNRKVNEELTKSIVSKGGVAAALCCTMYDTYVTASTMNYKYLDSHTVQFKLMTMIICKKRMESDRASGKLQQYIQAKFRKIAGFCPELHHLRNAEITLKMEKMDVWDPDENEQKQTEEKTDEVSVKNVKQSDQASASITASNITVSEQVKSMHLDDEAVAKMLAEEDAEEFWKVKRYDEARKMFMQLIKTPEHTSHFAALLLKLSFCCIVAGDVGEGGDYFEQGVQILQEGPQCEPKCAKDLVLVAERFAEQKLVKRSLFLMQIIVGLIKGIQNVGQQLDVCMNAMGGLGVLIQKYDYGDANQLLKDLISCSRRGQEAPDDQYLLKWISVMSLCIHLFGFIGNTSSGLKYLEEAETVLMRLNDGDEKTYLKVSLLQSRIVISLESKKFVEAKHFFSEMKSILPKIHGITDTKLKEDSLDIFETTNSTILM
ncbi:uncharacterized protein LOC144745366 [Ciona intestinalis]